jgi:hypothetical protein
LIKEGHFSERTKMEVPAGQDGIQQLLVAEQEAQAIVTTARKGKGNYIVLINRISSKQLDLPAT